MSERTDPPAAMRARFEKRIHEAHPSWGFGRDEVGKYQKLETHYAWLGWQAALPSPERIEAIARTIAGQCSAGKRMVEEDVAAILREELGGENGKG